jgi:integrase
MIFKRGSVWWYEFTFRGRRYRASTRTPNRKLAERAERKKRDRLAEVNAHLDAVRAPIAVTKAVETFLEENDHWADRTKGIHENSWVHLKPHFSSLLLQDITPATISRYRTVRRKEGAGPRSINIEVGLIRMVMIKHRCWHNNIAEDLRMLTEPEDIGRALSADEEHRLLTAAKKSVSRSLYPAVVLSIHTGMRNQEVRLLRWRQVDLLREEITVGKSKTAGGEGRVIPLNATALECLKDWRSKFPEAQPAQFVFPSERYGLHGKKGTFGGEVRVYDFDPATPIASWKSAWTTARKNAGVTCRWHDMRHTFVSRCGEKGVADATLMGISGHLSRKMLERYSHPRMEAKRAAVRMLDGGEDYPQNHPQANEPNSDGVM